MEFGAKMMYLGHMFTKWPSHDHYKQHLPVNRSPGHVTIECQCTGSVVNSCLSVTGGGAAASS